jgi:glucose 1-dehydrogenase
MQLQGKLAIVTGAARGIGAAIAKRFLQAGATVILSDIEEEAGLARVNDLKNHGNALFFPCDVSTKAQIEALLSFAETKGGADIFVSNAGIIHACDFLELEEKDFDRVINVNLKGAFLGGQAAAKQMVRLKKAGCIINMSSVNALLAIPNQMPYNVSKGGIKQLTNVMALSLAPHNIRVNAIGPGSIMTEMMQTLLTSKEATDKIMSRTPLGRFGEVEEIAEIALFLASDASSYITGQTIYADGGRLGLNYTVAVKP